MCDNVNSKWTLVGWLIKSLASSGTKSRNSYLLFLSRAFSLDQICLSGKTPFSDWICSVVIQPRSYQRCYAVLETGKPRVTRAYSSLKCPQERLCVELIQMLVQQMCELNGAETGSLFCMRMSANWASCMQSIPFCRVLSLSLSSYACQVCTNSWFISL